MQVEAVLELARRIRDVHHKLQAQPQRANPQTVEDPDELGILVAPEVQRAVRAKDEHAEAHNVVDPEDCPGTSGDVDLTAREGVLRKQRSKPQLLDTTAMDAARLGPCAPSKPPERHGGPAGEGISSAAYLDR